MRRTAFGFSPIVVLFLHAIAQSASPDVPDLLKSLKGTDPQARIQAEDALGDLGAAATEAVPDLIATLKDDSAEVRWHACRALGAIGPKAEAAVPALISALSDSDTKVRTYAAFALGRIGKAAMPAVDGLVAAAFDKDPQIRRVSLQALRAIEPPPNVAAPIWLKALESAEPAVAATAVAAIAEQGKEVLPKVRQLMKNPKAAYWACLIVAQMGPDAAEAVPDLVDVLKHDDPDVQLEALLALGEIGQAAASAAPTIVQELSQDAFPHVRIAAAYALAKIHADSPDVKVALQTAQESNQPLLRLVSTWALVQLNPSDAKNCERAVDLAMEAIGSEDASLKMAGARVLTEMPAIDRPLVAERLVRALQSDDPYLVGNVIDALASLGPGVVEKILPSLQNPALRHHTLRVFAHLGPRAAAAVPALIKAIDTPSKDPDEIEFRGEAQMVLAQIGPAAKAAVPSLLRSLESDNEQVRGSAAFALGRIGPEASEALPKLREMFQSEPNGRLRRLMVWTALRINPGNPRLEKAALPILINALQNEQETVRAEAAITLGDIGAPAKFAIPDLEKLKKDSSAAVRVAAEEAIKSIEKAAAESAKEGASR